MTTQTDRTTAAAPDGASLGPSLAVPLLRITLGVIILVTWVDNLRKDVYTGDGLTGLINWLFAEDGNNSSLGFYESILDSVVVPAAGFFGGAQLVVELLFGIGLLLGVFTRLSSLLAIGFFFSLFLGYFGGNEWIWTYVLLMAASLTVFLGWGGRRFGVDQMVAARRGPSPFGLLW
ncbi:MAG: DoxX family membrane protein [Actinomycetota bacterium]